MAALKEMIRLVFWKDAAPHRQFCGISNAMQDPIRLAGDRKASCFSGYEMAHMDSLSMITVVNGR